MKLFLSLSLGVLSLLSHAQVQEGIEVEMTERVPHCMDVNFNSLRLFPAYYNAGKLDSAQMVIDYTTYHCGDNSYMNAAQFLLHWRQNILPKYERLEDVDLPVNKGCCRNRPYFGYDFPQARMLEFEAFLDTAFAKLPSRPNWPQYLQDLHADLLNNTQTFYSNLHDQAYSNLPLQADYDLLKAAALNDPFGQVYVTTGAWVPTMDLKTIGVKPFFGMGIGGGKGRLFANFDMAIRPGKAASMYEVYTNDSLFVTREHIGGMIGLNAGFSLIKSLDWDLNLIGGVAYDGIDVYTPEENDPIEAARIGTSNLNIGIEIKHFVWEDTYFSLTSQYHVLNYATNGGSSLQGNAFTMGLRFGFQGGSKRADFQRKTGYYTDSRFN